MDQLVEVCQIVEVCKYWEQREQSEFAVRAMQKYRCLCDAEKQDNSFIYCGFATAKSFQRLSLLFRYYYFDGNDDTIKAAHLLEKALAETRKEMWNPNVDALGQHLSNLNVG
jgi:hypothetical protein